MMRRLPIPEHVKTHIAEQLKAKGESDGKKAQEHFRICGICGSSQWQQSTEGAKEYIAVIDGWLEQPCRACDEFRFNNPQAFNFFLRSASFMEFLMSEPK